MTEQYGLGLLQDRDTARAARLYPAVPGESARLRRKWNQNGAWLDQGPYGTCVGNAAGHRRADGPILVENITQTWAQKLYLEASAIYWGEPDVTMQKGTSIRSACDVLMRRKAIDRFEWMSDGAALRYALLERGSVLIGMDWYGSMYSPVRVGDQKYMRIDYATRKVGGHALLVNGIDLDPADGLPPYYRIKNSWGRDWGTNGTVRIDVTNDTDTGLEDLADKGWVDLTLVHELPRAA